MTIASTPVGRAFTVVGAGCAPGGYTTPQVLQWTPGAGCTVAFVSPHSIQVGTQYSFAAWQDGVTAASRVITAPAQAATYTGIFTTEYLLSVQAHPGNGGTATGGGWYTSGSVATVGATAASGYRFVDWTGVQSSATATAATVIVYSPTTVMANFAPLTNTLLTPYSAVVVASGQAAGGKVINDYGQIVGRYGQEVFLWTPPSANATVGAVTGLRSAFTAGNVDVYVIGINNHGQVVANAGDAARLWTPSSANATQGATATISETNAASISDFGQVVGSGYLWTPSSANSTAGTLSANSQIITAVSSNAYGQVLMLNQQIHPQGMSLFVPSSARSATGAFVTLPGLTTTTGEHALPVAVNSGGTVLGYMVSPFWSTGGRAFLWKPTSANAATGLPVEIPTPTGFSSMRPTALNDNGDVVGTMVQAGTGTTIPFLYTNNTVYDLTTVSGTLRNGTPAGINNKGQIVVNASNTNTVYLVSPTTPLPQPITATLNVSQVTFTAPVGGPVAPGPQAIQITLSGDNAASVQWTATPSQTWISVSKASGTGNGTFNITLLNPGLSAAGTTEGTVVVSAGISTISIRVALTVTPGSALSISASEVRFGTVAGTTAFTPQEVQIMVSGPNSASVPWTATANQNWLTVVPASGTGNGKIAIQPVNVNTATAGVIEGTVTIAGAGANTAIRVILTITAASAAKPPFGTVDTPTNYASVYGAVGVTGWALDDNEVAKIEVWRKSVPGEPHLNGQVYVGQGIFLDGARPDVANLYPAYPFKTRAGWGMQILTNMLPNAAGTGTPGNGQHELFVYATDKEGKKTLLGSRVMNVNNTSAVKPFGTLDTPASGGTAQGT